MYEAQAKSVTLPNSNEKILLLDTHEETRRTVIELLRSAGYDAEALQPDAEGLAGARQSNAAVLIMDECVPGAPCREFLAEWKGTAAKREGAGEIFFFPRERKKNPPPPPHSA